MITFSRPKEILYMRRSVTIFTRMHSQGWRFAAGSLVGSLALVLGGYAHAQNTIGRDVFAPGKADFVQNGSQVGRGPAFQFSDEFYAANGIDAQELRNQENGAMAPSRRPTGQQRPPCVQ